MRDAEGINAEVRLLTWEHAETTLGLPRRARAQLCCLEPCGSETLYQSPDCFQALPSCMNRVLFDLPWT